MLCEAVLFINLTLQPMVSKDYKLLEKAAQTCHIKYGSCLSMYMKKYYDDAKEKNDNEIHRNVLCK